MQGKGDGSNEQVNLHEDQLMEVLNIVEKQHKNGRIKKNKKSKDHE